MNARVQTSDVGSALDKIAAVDHRSIGQKQSPPTSASADVVESRGKNDSGNVRPHRTSLPARAQIVQYGILDRQRAGARSVDRPGISVGVTVLN